MSRQNTSLPRRISDAELYDVWNIDPQWVHANDPRILTLMREMLTIRSMNSQQLTQLRHKMEILATRDRNLISIIGLLNHRARGVLYGSYWRYPELMTTNELVSHMTAAGDVSDIAGAVNAPAGGATVVVPLPNILGAFLSNLSFFSGVAVNHYRSRHEAYRIELALRGVATSGR